MKLELITKHQSIALWDGWNNRFFACTTRGWGGWYSVLVKGPEGRSRLANGPRKSRIKRPNPMFWRRDEVMKYFARRLERFETRQQSQEGVAA